VSWVGPASSVRAISRKAPSDQRGEAWGIVGRCHRSHDSRRRQQLGSHARLMPAERASQPVTDAVGCRLLRLLWRLELVKTADHLGPR
jgi:hypothetical protein